MKNLRKIRVARSLTQEQLAAILGIGVPRLRRYEQCKNDPPPDLRHKIADELGATLDQLAGRAEFVAPPVAMAG